MASLVIDVMHANGLITVSSSYPLPIRTMRR
jgi:hypothetical protein